MTILKGLKSLKTSMSPRTSQKRLGIPGFTGMPPKHPRRCSVSALNRIMPPSVLTTVGHLPDMSIRLSRLLQSEGHKAIRYEFFRTLKSMTNTACSSNQMIAMAIELGEGGIWMGGTS